MSKTSHRKLHRLYTKYIIKNNGFYFGVMLICATIMFYLMITIKIDVRETYECQYVDGKLYIEEEFINIENEAFFYFNQNQKIYKIKLNKAIYDNGKLYIDIEADDRNNITAMGYSGPCYIEITIGSQNIISKLLY